MYNYPYVSTTSAVALVEPKPNQACDFWGLAATSMEAAGAMFLKIFWGGNSNATPVLGTTLPDVTISIPTTGLLVPFHVPLVHPGRMWFAVTKNNVGTDTTVLVTGGGVITLFLE
jgi:hypothetical protein